MSDTPCPGCRRHNLTYLAAHADAERRLKLGERQRKCPVCGRWSWPDELRPMAAKSGERGR